MGLGATRERTWRAASIAVGADLVDEPTLGRRRSSTARPGATTRTRHSATTISIDAHHARRRAGGRAAGPLTLEGSVFQGREPDEKRTDLDLGALDSHAGRLKYRRAGWQAQTSAGLLKEPEPCELLDVTRLTAPVEWSGAWRNTPVSALAAWGQNRKGGSSLDAYLLEGRGAGGRRTRSTCAASS